MKKGYFDKGRQLEVTEVFSFHGSGRLPLARLAAWSGSGEGRDTNFDLVRKNVKKITAGMTRSQVTFGCCYWQCPQLPNDSQLIDSWLAQTTVGDRHCGDHQRHDQ